MSEELLISDAAKEVQVESHVLRYWEEELGLTIQRNEWGHRFYTKEDVEKFKRIKDLKERGLQLKAIKMLMTAGRLEAFDRGGYELGEERGMAIEILEVRDAGEVTGRAETMEEAKRAEDAEEKVATEEGIFEGEVAPRRDETYFKKIDQLLRDKCFSPKKKRHFIF